MQSIRICACSCRTQGLIYGFCTSLVVLRQSSFVSLQPLLIQFLLIFLSINMIAAGIPSLKPRLCGQRVVSRSSPVVNVNRRSSLVVRAGDMYPQDWLKVNPLVLVLGVVGWTVPSAIPVSGFGGNSLFGLLTAQIGTELAHFPTGPALDSPFWLYLVTWHVGLFLTMLLGQVGFQGRAQKYW
eukprot:TRINITY_DN23_c0_g1_i3.p4 TRINITY_DN23_c0_g1~~TRINITY_DN23_c0_g1_i3.p4  ORF type:complete len:183 (+),score=5.14 TRINITY_DN23_c0_g1_i3:990-1538(+)